MEQPIAPHWAEIWVPGSIGLLLSGVPLFQFVRLMFLGWASLRWPTTTATITKSQIEERQLSPRVKLTFAKVAYRYEIAGDIRNSDHIRFGQFIEANAHVARSVVAKYPLGSTVNVRVSGSRSVLEPGSSGWLFLLIPLLAFLFGGVLYGLITGT